MSMQAGYQQFAFLSLNFNALFFQDIANKITFFRKLVHGGDVSKLQEIKGAILQMSAPLSLVILIHWYLTALWHCCCQTGPML